MFDTRIDFHVLGETASVREAIALIDTQRPAAVILDLSLEDGSGFAVLEACGGRADSPEFIVLSNLQSPAHRERCLALGARAVLDKATDASRVVYVTTGVLAAQARRGARPATSGGPPESNAAQTATAVLVPTTDDASVREIDEGDFHALLRRTQRLDAAHQITCGLVHDFGNLLSIISSSEQLARASLDEGQSDIHDDLESIRRAASAGGRLVHRVLSFARHTGESEARVVALKDVVADAEALLRPLVPRRTQLRFELAETDAPAFVAPDTIDHVLVNLVRNACAAIDGEGTVTIEVRPATALEVRRLGASTDAATVLAVHDSGEGIAPERLGALFQPFQTTGQHRTGLGLYMVRALVEQHGGIVFAESVPGQGTSFTIVLPAPVDAARIHAVA